ncbi:MAG: hypothetical protein J6K15_06330 [Lachnospiraceae bacterium]|nr:hypothetical protein [Lachnospiraceae bacterium]
MGRIDLQLFALKLNTDTSIVDYLKSKGQDSSYNGRKKLANQYGISNYTGTAAQNTQLLQMLKSSSASNTAANKNASGTSATAGSKSGAGNVGTGVVAAGLAMANQIAGNAKKNASEKNTPSGTTGGVAGNAAQTAANLLAQQNNNNIANAVVNNAGMVSSVAKSEVAPVQQAVERPSFTPSKAPVYTAPQYSTPTFTQTQAPVYKGQTTQANQAVTMDQRLPADVLAAMNSQFQVSQAYQQAMEYTNSLLQQLSSGKTTYSDQIAQLMNEYQNREAFSYNADTDPLFQQALASAMRSGKTAMQDSMGQAAALSGGYASSYAANVGQSAYNRYVQEAYDMLPQYYNIALDTYEREGQNMLNQLSMMDNADSKEYERLYNAYGAHYNNAQNLYSQEYSAWQDKVNNAYNYAGMLNSDYWNKMDYDESVRQYNQNFDYQKYQDEVEQNRWQNEFNYQQYQDQMAQNQWQSEFDYQKYLNELEQNRWQNEFDYQQYQDALNQSNIEWEQNFAQSEADREQSNMEWEQNFAQSEANREQSNWEKDYAKEWYEYNTSLGEEQRQFDESMGEDKRQFDANLGEDKRQFDASLGEEQRQYNSSLAEDKRQFNESLGEDQRQFDESLSFDKEMAAQEQANYEREMAIKESQAQSEEAKANGEYEYKTPTQKMYNEAMEAYEAGGEMALERYLETAPDYDIIALYDYAIGYGTIAMEARTYTKTKDTINWMGGVDNNDVVVDQYGNKYKLSDLPDSIRKQLTSLKEGESYDFSTGQKVTR